MSKVESHAMHVMHAVNAWLNTTENWLLRLIEQQEHSKCSIATDRQLDCEFQLPGVQCYRSPIQPRLRESMRVSLPLRLRRAATRASYPWYLVHALRGHKVDVIHSHFATVGWRFRKVSHKLGAMHVVSFYGFDYEQLGKSSPMWKSRLQELFAKADHFVCEGPHGASLLVAQGCSKDKISVVRLGVDPGAITFRPRTKQVGSLRLLQIASFKEKKGHIDTIRAFADALAEAPNMHLTFVGTTPGLIHDAIVEIINFHGIDSQVSLQPGVEFNELHAMMSDYDVFIHPSCHASNGDCEGGAPIVLLDAQATGMPVISTTHCDIPMEVVDGATGILCAEHDITALSQAILHFYDMDQENYNKFAHAARMHVEQNFDARHSAAALESVYAELLER